MGNKNIVVGFEKKDNLNYPHLKQTVEYLQKDNSYDYVYFSQRGYFIDSKFSLKSIYFFILFIKDFFKVIYLRLTCKYNIVVAIDNFSYIIYSIFFKNTILWSHDFVTMDQWHSNCFVQRKIREFTFLFLKKNRKIIIQDNERLILFADTYLNSNYNYLDIFYFPVSLMPIKIKKIKKINLNFPTLMQIGGINEERSGSDLLISFYQTMHRKLNLILHGYFTVDIKNKIKNSEHIPLASTLELLPNEVYKIVEKSDIGFICYRTKNKNFFFTKYASGQLVEFLKCSKPVIVMGNTNLKEFVTSNKIGIGISKIEDLEDAILNIISEYQLYSENSIKCYDNVYNIDLYLEKLKKWLND